MIHIFNSRGERIGFQTLDGSTQALGTSPDAEKLRGWLKAGVPARKGAVAGNLIIEVEDVMSPQDARFGMALDEQFEREGWTHQDDRDEETQANEGFDEAQHPRDDAGKFAPKEGGGRTDTPEFKAWFGKSKVVDSEGKPLRVYHGTTASFKAFDPDKSGEANDYGYAGKGIYFMDDTEWASAYAEISGKPGANVMPVYLSMKNPRILKRSEAYDDLYPQSVKGKIPNKEQSEAVQKHLKAQGYDGVIVEGSPREFVVFSPTQIKSVFNRGTWSKDDPHISNEGGVRCGDGWISADKTCRVGQGAVAGVKELLAMGKPNPSKLLGKWATLFPPSQVVKAGGAVKIMETLGLKGEWMEANAHPATSNGFKGNMKGFVSPTGELLAVQWGGATIKISAHAKQMAEADDKSEKPESATVTETALTTEKSPVVSPGVEPGSSPSQPLQIGADWKKLTGKLGTSEGGQYQAPDGKLYYVKWMDAGRVRNEILAGELYKLAGSPVVDYRYARGPNGEWGTAAPWKESKKADWSSKADKDEAAKDFATHAWLANWDCIGAGSENPMDNQKIGPDGKMFTVDTGGALRYSGMGTMNPDKLKPTADEWTTLRDPYKNASAAAVFKGMTGEQLKASAAKLNKVTPEQITAAVDKAYDGAPPSKLAETLIKRREDLLDKSGVGVWEAKESQPTSGPTLKQAFAALPKLPSYDEVKAAKAATVAPKVGVSGESWVSKGAAPVKPEFPASGAAFTKKANLIESALAANSKEKLEQVYTLYNKPKAWEQKIHGYHVAAYQHLGGTEAELNAKMVAMGGKATQKIATGESKQVAETLPKAPKVEKTPPPKPTLETIKVSAADFDPVPPPNSKAFAQVNKEAMEKAYAMALAKDLHGLESMHSPSSQVMTYKGGLISVIKDKLTPPTHFESNETLDTLHNSIKTVTDHEAAPRTARFIDAGSPGVNPELQFDATNTESWYVKGKEASKNKAAWESLSSEEQSAIKNYVGGQTWHDQLRFGKITKTAEMLAKAMITKGMELPANVVIQRNINLPDAKDLEAMTKSVGKVLQDPGFFGTGTAFEERNVHLHCKTMPGVKGLWFKPASSTWAHENEFVTTPNQRMYVTGVKKVGGKLHVFCWLLPTLPNQCCEGYEPV